MLYSYDRVYVRVPSSAYVYKLWSKWLGKQKSLIKKDVAKCKKKRKKMYNKNICTYARTHTHTLALTLDFKSISLLIY